MPIAVSCPQWLGRKAVCSLHASYRTPTGGATSLSANPVLKTQLKKFHYGFLSRGTSVVRRHRLQRRQLHVHASDDVSNEELVASSSEEVPAIEKPQRSPARKALVKHDWLDDHASLEAYDRWVQPAGEKHGGLPLPAVVSLTAGSLALAIVLALQGWSRIRHRVPPTFRLRISTSTNRHKGPAVQEPDSGDKLPGTEPQSALSTPQQTAVNLHEVKSTQENRGKGRKKDKQTEQSKGHSGEASAATVPHHKDVKNDEDTDKHLKQLASDERVQTSKEAGHPASDADEQGLVSQTLPKGRKKSPEVVKQQVIPEGSSSGDQPDLRGVLVLKPSLDVSSEAGDGRKAPPSSPVQNQGQSQESPQESKAPAPAEILKAAADSVIHQAKHLVDHVSQDSNKEQEAHSLERDEEVEKQDSSQDKVQGLEESEGAPKEQHKGSERLDNPKALPDQHAGHKQGFVPLGLLGLPHLPDSESLESHSLASSEPASIQDDESHPSLAGGKDAALQQPPAREEVAEDKSSAGVGGLDSFQEWYAKHKGPKPKASTSEGSAPENRSTKELKPSTYVDVTQAQALQALQKLSVIEEDVNPAAACTRRDFARWLLNGSGVLTGNSATRRVFPVPSEGVAERAFDDVSPSDDDFAVIQGLAEAGIVSSKLSHPSVVSQFHPNEPLSRQELVRWKLALDRRRLPTLEEPAKAVSESWGFTDVALIDSEALPAVLADYEAGEQSVIGRAFGYTLRFQPQKSVSVAQAASALASGSASEFLNEKVSEMEAYKAADEVFLEEAREQRAIVEAVAAKGEELAKQLEEDKGTLEETRKTTEEAIKELEAHRAAIREENAELAKAVEEARAVISELSSVRSVSEGERNALGAELQKLSDQKEAVERVTSEAMDTIDDEIKRARAAVEGLGGVREVLIDGRIEKEVGSRDKPLVEVFDEGVEAASERSRNVFKEAARIAKREMGVAREKVMQLCSNMKSSSAEGMAALKEKSRHVTERSSAFLQEAPERIKASVPSDIRGRVGGNLQTVWSRLKELLALVWGTLLSIWHWIVEKLKAGKEQARHAFSKVHIGNRDASSKY